MSKLVAIKLMSIQSRTMLIAASNPGQLGVKIIGDLKGWLLMPLGGFATVQFIMAMMDYMSKDMQKQSQGKDHAVRACIGLVLAFSAGTIMSYLETQAGSWSAMSSVITMLRG